MELTDLVEQAIRSDFSTDDIISNYAAVPNDFSQVNQSDDTQPALPFLVVITCTDRGDFTQCPGIGIKMVDVEVSIQFNLGEEAEWAGRVTLLSMLAERIDDRLGAATHSPEGDTINDRFTRRGLKIFGILSEKPKSRSHLDLSRERVITREFICAQTG